MSKEVNPKETILVITVAFLLAYVLFHSKLALYFSMAIGLSGIFSTLIAEKIDWFWNKLSKLLGAVNNYILLTLLFFLILTPMGLIRRLFKKNTMGRPTRSKIAIIEAGGVGPDLNGAGNREGGGHNPAVGSSFEDRHHLYTGQDLENTW